MSTVYIHIGTPKTGTTALQNFLCRNRETLLSQGFLYPLSGRRIHPISGHYSHHNLAWALSQAKAYNPEFGNWEDLLKEIKSAPLENIVISSEQFCKLNFNHISLIKKHLSEYETKIIIYLRRQDEFLKSYYFEEIKRGCYWDSFNKYIETKSELLDYYNLIESWQKVFGKNNIDVRIYEKQQLKYGLIDDFLKSINLTLDENEREDIKQQNVTPSLKVVKLMRFLNAIAVGKMPMPPSRMRKLYSRLLLDIDNIVLSRIVEKIPNFVLGDELIPIPGINILNEFKESNQKVAQEYLGRQDGKLFYSTPEQIT